MSILHQYIYRIQTVRPAMLSDGLTDEESQIVAAHFDYLKTLTDQGTVLLAGRTAHTESNSFGIVIFLAENDQAANDIVQNDPAVINRVMRAELFPFRTALISPAILDK